MNRLRVLFFFGLLAIVIIIARSNSRPNSRAESPTFSPAPVAEVASTPAAAPSAAPIANQTPAAQAMATPSAEFQKIAERAAPAVVLISAFDQSGKLLRSSNGCFFSGDGRLVTNSATVQGAAHAVAKVSDGRILNITGILADNATLDVAILKADTKKGVPFLSGNKSAKIDNGTRVAVVGSPLTKRKPAHFESAISARRSDPKGEWLELSTAIPNECAGAPIVNEKGELIGLVTSQHAEGSAAYIVRNVGTLETVVARIDPHVTVGWPNEPPAPAEGPTKLPPRFAKIPLVRADQPGNSKLIYSPKPSYPNAARGSATPLRGTGRYRVRFSANGAVQNVEVLESTRNQTLDSAALNALRQWKATPGQEWSATVPISFQP